MGGNFTNQEFACIVKELGFIRIYTSPNTPMNNSVIEHTHSFLKASMAIVICNHNTDWYEFAFVAIMTYNGFLHSVAG